MITGRPTDYDPAYCETAITFLADGYSLAALAGSIGVSRSTIYNWVDVYPDFMDAVKIGQAKAVLWWENRNRALAQGEDGNATAIVFGLKNRAADEWRDVKATEISGPDGGPISVKPQPAEWTIIDPPTESGT